MVEDKNGVGQQDAAQRSAQQSEADDEQPWQRYRRRKQALRLRLRRNYLQLVIFTLLFGILTIGLRLDLRYTGGQSLYRLQQWLQYLWSGRADNADTLQLEQILSQARPAPAQLKALEGRILSPERLPLAEQSWGSSRVLIGSSKELELRYFAQAEVYLLRKRSDWRIVYAGLKAP